MEDSGIDSDSKQEIIATGSSIKNLKCSYSYESEIREHKEYDASSQYKFSSPPSLNTSKQLLESSISTVHPRLMSTIQLQKRLERQIQEAKKIRQLVKNETSEPQKCSLIPRNRLPVPYKSSSSNIVTKADEQPLVSWESESEEDFQFQSIQQTEKEITIQLDRDGYNLDSTPDDEDLDLIPPTPLNKRWSCCFFRYSCTLM